MEEPAMTVGPVHHRGDGEFSIYIKHLIRILLSLVRASGRAPPRPTCQICRRGANGAILRAGSASAKRGRPGERAAVVEQLVARSHIMGCRIDMVGQKHKAARLRADRD